MSFRSEFHVGSAGLTDPKFRRSLSLLSFFVLVPVAGVIIIVLTWFLTGFACF